MHKRLIVQNFRPVIALALAMIALGAGGCGSSEPATEGLEAADTETQWARVQRQVDSLTAENRRLREQITALAAENRRLTAQNEELEATIDAFPAQDAGGTAPAAAPKASPVPAAYTEGTTLYQQRKYKEAIDRFEDALSTRLDPSLADNCHYLIGESHFALKNYEKAVQHFEAAAQYKNGDKAAEAQFMLGTTYAAMGEGEAARQAFGTLIRTHPNSPLARKARERIGKLQ